jgi:hypothetical protein
MQLKYIVVVINAPHGHRRLCAHILKKVKHQTEKTPRSDAKFDFEHELNKSTCTAHIHPGARDSALCAICLMGKDVRDELDPTPPSPAGLVPQVIMFETMLSVRPTLCSSAQKYYYK